MKSKFLKNTFLILLLLALLATAAFFFDKSRGFSWYFRLKGYPFSELVDFRPSPKGDMVAYLTRESATRTAANINHFIYLTRESVEFPEKLFSYSIGANRVEELKGICNTGDTAAIVWSVDGRYLLLSRVGFFVWGYDFVDNEKLIEVSDYPTDVNEYIVLDRQLKELLSPEK